MFDNPTFSYEDGYLFAYRTLRHGATWSVTTNPWYIESALREFFIDWLQNEIHFTIHQRM